MEGSITACEFSIVIWSFFENIIQKYDDTIKKIILYSDGCYYQNRNTTLLNVLLNFPDLHNIVIKQKYLIKGHIQMNMNSMYATI